MPASEVAAGYPGSKRFDDWRVMLEEMDKQIGAVVVKSVRNVLATQVLLSLVGRGPAPF